MFYSILQTCEEVIKKCSKAIANVDFEPKLYADRMRKDVGYAEQFLKGGSSVLDVGCGKGHLSGIFSKLGYNAIGIDLPVRINSSFSLNSLTKRYSVLGLNFNRTIISDLKIQSNTLQKLQTQIWRSLSQAFNSNYTMGDGRDLPFQPQTFGAVVNCAVIEHVEKEGGLSAFLKEEVRVLKDGGHFFVFLCPRKNSYIEKIFRLTEEGHEKLFDEKSVVELLEESGLEILMIKRTSIVPRFAPIELQPLHNLISPALSLLDAVLVKTPLEIVSHDLCVVARKPRRKTR